jgi:molecular chaperone DnaK (HSP70)
VRADKRPTVGLDFGTSTTLVASPNGIVPIGTSYPWMPSLVGYGDDGSIVVGDDAEALAPEQVVRSVKRSITEQRNFVRVDTAAGLRDVRTDELIVEVLRAAIRRGQERGQDLGAKGVVRMGCPAMWDGRQRRRLLQAAQRADLPVTLNSLVDEPVAAGIAWLAGQRAGRGQPNRPSEQPLRVLVFDMGGGTLDVAVLDVRGLNHHDVSVLTALGIAEAGDALDEAIAVDLDYALAAVHVDVDSLSHPMRARGRLLAAAREAKVALSTAEEYVVSLPRRLFGISELIYTRDQLNEVFQAQMDRAEQYVAAALRAARLTEEVPGTAYDIARTPIEDLVRGVDVVVLSGGMSQIPYVAERLRAFFEPTTSVEMACVPSENAVAIGLANAGRYGRINMYRPAFDILLEWNHGADFRVVYEAFTPLVETWQIARGGADLRFARTGLDLSLPRQGKGRLRVVSHTDDRVRATLGGSTLDGFPVALSEQKFEFAIYPNGRIRMTDGTGSFEGHVQDWYTMRDPDDG